mmetsp:Transcript_37180/g.104911  ORF Transcript_37180/g.104911 Transcript_37180/m.104911 type:complete len:332 (+) Transcript_37180:682-1677(+)
MALATAPAISWPPKCARSTAGTLSNQGSSFGLPTLSTTMTGPRAAAATRRASSSCRPRSLMCNWSIPSDSQWPVVPRTRMQASASLAALSALSSIRCSSLLGAGRAAVVARVGLRRRSLACLAAIFAGSVFFIPRHRSTGIMKRTNQAFEDSHDPTVRARSKSCVGRKVMGAARPTGCPLASQPLILLSASNSGVVLLLSPRWHPGSCTTVMSEGSAARSASRMVVQRAGRTRELPPPCTQVSLALGPMMAILLKLAASSGSAPALFFSKTKDSEAAFRSKPAEPAVGEVPGDELGAPLCRKSVSSTGRHRSSRSPAGTSPRWTASSKWEP